MYVFQTYHAIDFVWILLILLCIDIVNASASFQYKLCCASKLLQVLQVSFFFSSWISHYIPCSAYNWIHHVILLTKYKFPRSESYLMNELLILPLYRMIDFLFYCSFWLRYTMQILLLSVLIFLGYGCKLVFYSNCYSHFLPFILFSLFWYRIYVHMYI